MTESNDESPHSIAIWVQMDIQARKSDGQLTGSPKDVKRFSGVFHLSDRQAATLKAEEIVNLLKNNIKENINE